MKHAGTRSLPRLVWTIGSILAVALLAACGGGGTSTTPIAAPSVTTLATATNTVCVTPSSSTQSVALPATGGVSGTISFGAYPAGAAGCDSVVISTGADVTTAELMMRSAQDAVRESNANSSAPLLTISVGEAFGSSGPVSAFGYQTIVSGMQLTVAPNLNFPDGTYYATVTASGQTFIIPFTAKGGVLTVAGGAAGLPVLILAGSSALITLYQQGVMPNTPSPSPSSSASASPSASPSPTGGAPSGQPVPDGTTIGSAILTIEGQPNNLNGTQTTTPIVYYASLPIFTASVFNGGILPGITTYVISGLNAESYRVDGCKGQISYSGTGLVGTFNVPFLSSGVFQISDTCSVDLFSAPASVVNAAPNYGFGYDIYTMASPVTQESAPYSPAINTGP
jgi:hypothetical protein